MGADPIVSCVSARSYRRIIFITIDYYAGLNKHVIVARGVINANFGICILTFSLCG